MHTRNKGSFLLGIMSQELELVITQTIRVGNFAFPDRIILS